MCCFFFFYYFILLLERIKRASFKAENLCYMLVAHVFFIPALFSLYFFSLFWSLKGFTSVVLPKVLFSPEIKHIYIRWAIAFNFCFQSVLILIYDFDPVCLFRRKKKKEKKKEQTEVWENAVKHADTKWWTRRWRWKVIAGIHKS